MLTGLSASRAEALRHISIVEVGVTPILNVLCFKGSERSCTAMSKNYKLLTTIIHSDKVTRGEVRQAHRFIVTLIRAFEFVEKAVAAQIVRPKVQNVQEERISNLFLFKQII